MRKQRARISGVAELSEALGPKKSPPFWAQMHNQKAITQQHIDQPPAVSDVGRKGVILVMRY